jgi:predicted HTH domain antitoxin
LSVKVITINIPDSIDAKEAAMIIAVGLYERGKLSLGQAANVAGLTKRIFAESLGSYGVSIFNYPASDIINDVKNAGKVGGLGLKKPTNDANNNIKNT